MEQAYQRLKRMESAVGNRLVAFDQSSSHVGFAIFEKGAFAVGGDYKPDKPNYDALRNFVKNLVSFGDTVVLESVYLGLNPHVYEELIRVQSHIWAAARDAGCSVNVVTPFEALKALTGITNPKTKSANRKAAMVEHAARLVGETVSEHQADAIGLALAYLRR